MCPCAWHCLSVIHPVGVENLPGLSAGLSDSPMLDTVDSSSAEHCRRGIDRKLSVLTWGLPC